MSGWLRLRIATTGAVMIALAGPALTLTQDNLILAALDLCTNMTEEIESARETLKTSGWQSSDDTAAIALYNAKAVFQFDSTEVDYTFRNAEFMAASILGNSSLGRDQIGVQAGKYTLAVLGLREGTRYCVLTGPETLFDTLTDAESFAETTRQSSETVLQVTGVYRDRFTATVGHFKSSELDAALSASDMPADRVAEAKSFLSPVTIHIISSEFRP